MRTRVYYVHYRGEDGIVLVNPDAVHTSYTWYSHSYGESIYQLFDRDPNFFLLGEL